MDNLFSIFELNKQQFRPKKYKYINSFEQIVFFYLGIL